MDWITHDDLSRAFAGRGAEFEQLLEDLIRAEASVCGIRQTDISRDPSVTSSDGGGDIWVHAAPVSPSGFLPASRSVWACRSGAGNSGAGELRTELTNPKHQDLRQALDAGYTYCWCIVKATYQARSALAKGADGLVRAHGWGIAPVLGDMVVAWIKRHPAVAYKHFPRVRDIGVCRTLDEWAALPEALTEWVPFGDRDRLVDAVADHLYGSGDRRLLYVVGLSGAGKSRAALEACQRAGVGDILYYESYSDYMPARLSLMRGDRALTARLVIDDVQVAEWDQLLRDCDMMAPNMRILAIGPGQVKATRDDVLHVASASSDEVARVVQANRAVTASQSREIASDSDHDLHLALLLGTPCPAGAQPIDGPDRVWRRLQRLHPATIDSEFADSYRCLATSLDVDVSGGASGEVGYLANAHGSRVPDLCEHMRIAVQHGLGGRYGRYYEPRPRALANWAFRHRAWPRIEHDVERLVADAPERLARRLLERSLGCGDAQIAEVVRAAYAARFRAVTGGLSVAGLAGAAASRALEAYAAIDPSAALGYMGFCVAAAYGPGATEAAVSAVRMARSQVVWLCQSLACFDEYWGQCERTLYALAAHETDLGIANNSTEVWTGLFLHVLSWSALPFARRFEVLRRRVAQCSLEDLPVVMRAVLRIFETHTLRARPEPLLRDRIAPEEWRPDSLADLYQLRRDAWNGIIAELRRLPADLQARARTMTVHAVGNMLSCGLIPEMQAWLDRDQLDSEDTRNLVAQLELHVAALALHRANPAVLASIGTLRDWRDRLQVTDAREGLRWYLSRPQWEHEQYARDEAQLDDGEADDLALRRRGSDAVAAQLGAYAQALLADAAWLDSVWEWQRQAGDAVTVRSLGRALARERPGAALVDRAERDIATGIVSPLLLGWSAEVAEGEMHGAVAARVAQALDSAAAEHPRPTVAITLEADCTVAGLTRVLSVLHAAGPPVRELVLGLGMWPWRGALDAQHHARVIDAVRALGPGDSTAWLAALELVGMWYVDAPTLPSEVEAAVLRLAEHAVGDTRRSRPWDLPLVLRKCQSPEALGHLARLAFGDTSIAVREHAARALSEQARSQPGPVMAAVGSTLAAQTLQTICKPHHGLLEAIGVADVSAWLATADPSVRPKAARALAFHADSPCPAGSAVGVPPVTAWLLDEFEGDDAVGTSFLLGRHHFEMRSLDDTPSPESVRDRLAPCLEHANRWIVAWAQQELDLAQREHGEETRWKAEIGRE